MVKSHPTTLPLIWGPNLDKVRGFVHRDFHKPQQDRIRTGQQTQLAGWQVHKWIHVSQPESLISIAQKATAGSHSLIVMWCYCSIVFDA